MPVWLFLQVLRSRWKLAVALWLGVVVAVLMATTLGAWQYSAASTVLVEPKAPEPNAAPLPAGGHMPTEIEVLRSERVALRAIDSLGLQDHAGWQALWQKKTRGAGEFRPWLAARLLERLDVRTARDANVLTVVYTSADPATASAIANAFTQAYVAVSTELRQEPVREFSAYFDQRARQLRDNLQEAQRKRTEFQQRTGLVASSGSMDTEMLRLAELSSQVAALQATSAAASSRSRQSARGGVDEVLRDPVVTALTSELARQENRLAELRTRMGEQHPIVVELRDGVSDLRGRVDTASRRVASTLGSEDRVASERLAQARKALEDQRARMLGMGSQRDQALVLEREVDNAQRAYDAALNRASQTALESGGGRRTVSMLRAASRPLFPSWPNIPLCLAAAAVLGLSVALAGVFLRERSDRRLRTTTDQDQAIGLPVLVVLRRRTSPPRPALRLTGA